MANKRRIERSEFRPDPKPILWLKSLRLTRLQRLRLLKWVLYVATIVGALVIQDVIMSRVHILGATTELAVPVILLITVIEGTEVGSLFALIASVAYFYTGSAPNAISIGLICFPGIIACMLRQMFWHRSRASIILFAGLAAMVYSLGMYVVGVSQDLTRWDTLPLFTLSGAYNVLMMIPLYPLIVKIGLIGGNTWKE